MPEITLNETAPRFECVYRSAWRAGTSESPLGSILHTVEGTAGETVIEAQELTKNLAISRPRTMLISSYSAADFGLLGERRG